MSADLSRRGPWTLLAVLVIARIAFGVQFQSVGAVGPAMVSDLGLAYASLGTLVGAYSMLGLVLALPAGWLIAQFGDRRITLAGLGFMIAGGLLLAAAPGFGVALAGRLISGSGAVLLMVVLPTLVIKRFTGAALSTAMGTLLAGYPLGIGLGFAALPVVGSWRMAMAATAALAAVALFAAAITLAGNSVNATGTQHGFRLDAGEVAPVVAAGLLWGCLNAGFAVLLGFVPLFFVDHGMSADVAGALVSLTAFATVPMGPLGGWLLGRLPQPLLGIAGGIAVTSLAIVFLPQDIAPEVPLVAVGVALGAIAGPSVALPAAVLASEHRAVGMGLFWLMYFVPMTLLPPLAGLARDVTDAAEAPLYAAALFTALALAALIAYVGSRRRVIAAVDAG
jgi:predicted MFS family arabinose efflux permease